MRIPILLIGCLVAAAVVVACLAPATARAEMMVYLKLDGDTTNSSAYGSLYDGTLVEEDDGLDPAWVTGQVDQALDTNNLHVDDLRDYVEIPYKLPNAGTIMLWHFTECYNYNPLVDNSGSVPAYAANDYEIWAQGNGNVYAKAQHNKATGFDLDNIDGRDKWHHYTMTWEKKTDTTGRVDLYIDGKWRNGLDVDGIAGDGLWRDAGDYVYLGGGNHGNRPGDGLFDEVRIFNTVLTEAEIGSFIPEPCTLLLLVTGALLGIVARRRGR